MFREMRRAVECQKTYPANSSGLIAFARLEAPCGSMVEALTCNLTREACNEQAANCRKTAESIMTPAHRIMLEHIADTWDRIAADIYRVKSSPHLPT
jgi:hypothetical protein